MEYYGVPASIILAQGILESRCGTSKLAKEANNHFGIKHSPNWKGDIIKGKYTAYRKYQSDIDSYLDHSALIKSLKRYSFLFNYSQLDYRSLAKGLKKAGYAKDPKYPVLLIKLIEKYELYKFDIQFINTEGIAKQD
jgi:flagellum-specific peptidoglycan hydrolase FlgJ